MQELMQDVMKDVKRNFKKTVAQNPMRFGLGKVGLTYYLEKDGKKIIDEAALVCVKALPSMVGTVDSPDNKRLCLTIRVAPINTDEVDFISMPVEDLENASIASVDYLGIVNEKGNIEYHYFVGNTLLSKGLTKRVNQIIDPHPRRRAGGIKF